MNDVERKKSAYNMGEWWGWSYTVKSSNGHVILYTVAIRQRSQDFNLVPFPLSGGVLESNSRKTDIVEVHRKDGDLTSMFLQFSITLHLSF